MAFSFLDRASIFDIETTGLDPRRAGIWQAAVGHRRRGGRLEMREWARIRPETRFGRTIAPADMSPWTKASLAEHGIGFGELSRGMPRQQFMSELLGPSSLFKGRDVWIQNLPFESRWLAAMSTDAQMEGFVRDARLQTFSLAKDRDSGALRTRRIFTTAPGVDEAVSRAWKAAPGEGIKAWGGVFDALRAELTTPVPAQVTRFFDLQDLSRSMFALAQEHGYMRATGDVFTGTSVETFSRLALGVPEAHLAGADIQVQNQMLERYFSMAARMRAGRALEVAERDFLSAVSQLQPHLRRQNVAKTLASAWEDVMMAQRGEGPGYPVIKRRTPVDIEMQDWMGNILKKTITKSDYDHVRDFDEVTRLMAREQERRLRSGALHRSLAVDMSDLTARFGAQVARPYEAGLGAMDELLHGWDVANRVDEGIYARLAAGESVGPTPGQTRALDTAWAHLRRHGVKYLAGLGALGGLIAVSADLGSSKPLYGVAPGEPAKAPEVTPEEISGPAVRGEIVTGVSTKGLGIRDERLMSVLHVADKASITAEDADTAMIMMENGETHAIRMAGIDAPEVAHGDEYARGRVLQDQPYGEESTKRFREMLEEADQLAIAYSPTAPTSYGRTVGMVLAKQGDAWRNLNLELAREGMAGYLPYGRRKDSFVDRGMFRRASEEAYMAGRGMYSTDFWRKNFELTMGGRQITNVSFIQVERMRKRFETAATLRVMRDEEQSGRTAAGGKDDHNVLEAFGHAGITGVIRKFATDFGSGWNSLRGMRRAGETFSQMMKGKDFQRALADAVPTEVLGQGEYGRVFRMETSFRGETIQFARKVGEIGTQEVAAMRQFGDEFAPNVYRSGKLSDPSAYASALEGSIPGSSPSPVSSSPRARHASGFLDMELFEGSTLKQLATREGDQAVDKFGYGLKAISRRLHSAGVVHGDIHLSNVFVTRGGDIGLIDYGRAMFDGGGQDLVWQAKKLKESISIDRAFGYGKYSPGGLVPSTARSTSSPDHMMGPTLSAGSAIPPPGRQPYRPSRSRQAAHKLAVKQMRQGMDKRNVIKHDRMR